MNQSAAAAVAGGSGGSVTTPTVGAHDGGLDGAAILLGLLGGLMLAGLATSTFAFVRVLVKPFAVGLLGQEVQPNLAAWLVALLAFGSYLTNVFRQVHGLALVCTDRTYRNEVDVFLGRGHRMAALFGLLYVLIVPAATAALLSSDESYNWVRDAICRKSVADPYVAAAFGPGVICIAYLITMLFYFIWDLVVFLVLRNSKPSSGNQAAFPFWPNSSADTYCGYVRNWLSLCVLFGGPIAITLIVAAVLALLGIITPVQLFGSPIVYLTVLMTITFGYSVCDYYCNRRFYFGK